MIRGAVLEPHDVDVGVRADDRHTRYGRLELKPPGPRGARVHDEPRARSLDYRFVCVAEHNYIRFAGREQLRDCRGAELVPVAHVDGKTAQSYVNGRGQNCARSIRVAVHGIDRRNCANFGQESGIADVAGMKNQLDTGKRFKDFRAQQTVRVRDQPD